MQRNAVRLLGPGGGAQQLPGAVPLHDRERDEQWHALTIKEDWQEGPQALTLPSFPGFFSVHFHTASWCRLEFFVVLTCVVGLTSWSLFVFQVWQPWVTSSARAEGQVPLATRIQHVHATRSSGGRAGSGGTRSIAEHSRFFAHGFAKCSQLRVISVLTALPCAHVPQASSQGRAVATHSNIRCVSPCRCHAWKVAQASKARLIFTWHAQARVAAVPLLVRSEPGPEDIQDVQTFWNANRNRWLLNGLFISSVITVVVVSTGGRAWTCAERE